MELRERQACTRLNIPDGSDVIFPGDRLRVIGSDQQLTSFHQALQKEIFPDDYELEKREMQLRSMILSNSSPFVGKTLRDSGIRDQYNCMVVGLEEGKENLSAVSPSYVFQKGDIIWVVGEEESLVRLTSQKTNV